MSSVPRVALDWWLPAPGDPIGEERARELVAALRPVIRPVVREAVEDLRRRLPPDKRVQASAVLVSWIAQQGMDAAQRALCLGTVYELRSGDPQSNAIELLRDGTVTWWPGKRD